MHEAKLLLMKLKSALIDKKSWVRAGLRVALGPGKERTTGRMSGVWRLPFRRGLSRGNEADRGEVGRQELWPEDRGEGQSLPGWPSKGRRVMEVRLSLPADMHMGGRGPPPPRAGWLRLRTSHPTYWGCVLGQVTEILQVVSDPYKAQ